MLRPTDYLGMQESMEPDSHGRMTPNGAVPQVLDDVRFETKPALPRDDPHWRARVLSLLPPALVPLATFLVVAGWRWTIDESIQAGKGLAGLDQHQVRR